MRVAILHGSGSQEYTNESQMIDILVAYRGRLEEGGMSAAEAWALAQRLEERLLGPLYDDAERMVREGPDGGPGLQCPSCGGEPVEVTELEKGVVCFCGECGGVWGEG